MDKKEISDIIIANDIHVYIDPKTGVNYLVFHDKKGSSICPRFNADLTLYISKPDKK